MILLTGIPHSGTHFLRELFQDVPHKFHFLHQQQTNNIRHWMETCPVVCSLRHPRAMYVSFKRRGKDTSKLLDYWARLRDVLPDSTLYLPLDAELRQEYLDTINEQCGLELVTDWGMTYSPVAPDTPDTVDLTEYEENQATAPMVVWPEFFRRFYRD